MQNLGDSGIWDDCQVLGQEIGKQRLKCDRQARCSEGKWTGVFMAGRMLCTKIQTYFRLTGEIVKWGVATDEVGDVGKAR